MIAAQGILTSAGGTNSHAAVVARGEGIPAVCGADAIKIDLDARAFSANGTTVREGDTITIDGFTGNVFVGELPLTDSVLEKARQGDAAAQAQPIWQAFDRLMRIADDRRRHAGARQRRHAGPVDERAGARRRGDRPVPHRAHVPGVRAGRGRAADDLRGGRRRGEGRARRAAAVAEGRLRRDLPRDGRAARDGAAARPAAARVPARPDRAVGRGRARPRTWRGRHRAGAGAREGATAARDEPDARLARRAARDPQAGPVRDAGARDRRGGVRGAQGRRRPEGRDHDPAGGDAPGAAADARRARAGGAARSSSARASSSATSSGGRWSSSRGPR